MAPNENRNRSKKGGWITAHPPPGDEVVISGLSGQYPNADNVYEFRDKLFEKVDMICDLPRWNLDHPEIPKRVGRVSDLEKFDASFFGIHYKQAQTMDPMGRVLLEKAYEAIIDAGVNPQHLKGKRCGVFIGACFSETEKTWFCEKINVNGYGITGCSRTMLANRISYWLGVQGPSCSIDSACSSSLYALNYAYENIRAGLCDMALVGSCNLCLHPYVSLQFFRLGVLSQDGSCKSFDNSANGYCRSEAIAMVFLQKSKDARRIYATVVHTKKNCDGYKELGITYPSGQIQHQLLSEVYEDCGIDPTTVAFIEAHGTGTKVGDPEECNTLDKIFCTGRKEPLMIGSIKSNIGHSEPASGLCSVTKVIIAMESGFIPPNLHFKEPREGIPAFIEGRLKVVTEKQPWSGGLVGVNSFGFGGANCHLLLRWNEKEKINNGLPADDIPRLVAVSGRTLEAVEVFLDELESNPVDVEYVKLFHDIHVDDIPGHVFRGYTVLSSSGKKVRDIQYFAEPMEKICLFFSGLGSEWPAMGKSLMKIPIFSRAVEKCHEILKPVGVDLKKILTVDDARAFGNVINSCVAITAVQIGLSDILSSIGIYPDIIIGVSVGELGCAYADGCLTAEEAILASYYTGLAFHEADLVQGAMFIAEWSSIKVSKLLPLEVDIACYNGRDSYTLSGPADVMKKLSSELLKQGITVSDVPCFNIPFHSRYISKIKPKLLGYLGKVITNIKSKTSKWMCSVSPDSVNWGSSVHKFSSSVYHTEVMLNPVFLEDLCSFIPKSAVVIEMAPHGILQNFLKPLLKPGVLSLPIMERAADNCELLLKNIGKLFEVGFQPKLAALYPPVEYPVSRGTKMLSPYIRWEHSLDWHVTMFKLHDKMRCGARLMSINVKEEEFEYIVGHVIDGRNLFPATGYLVLVWETFALLGSQQYTITPVVFENVRFLRATTVPKEGATDFYIFVQKASGNFEIVEGGATIVTGKAHVPTDIAKERLNLPEIDPVEDKDLITLKSRDIYKELRLRGYQYKGLFRGLVSLDNLGQSGRVVWANNYVAFMDNLLQTQILQEDTRSLYVPTSIKRVVIDPHKHMESLRHLNPEDNTINVSIYKDIKVIISGGVEIHELRASQIPRKKALGEPVLERHLFVPHVTHDICKSLSHLETFRLCLHIVLENTQGIKVKVVELGDASDVKVAANYVAVILADLPLIQAEITLLAANFPKSVELEQGVTVEDKKITAEQNCLIVIAKNLLEDQLLLEQSLRSLKPEGFLIVRESPDKELPFKDFHVLVDRVVDDERILLLQKKLRMNEVDAPEVIKISDDDNYEWIEPLKKHILNPAVKSIILVAQREKNSGLLGLINCLRREPSGEKIRCVYIFDNDAPEFDLNNPLYAKQLQMGLAVNVLKNGEWGSYRHQALPHNQTIPVEHAYFNNETRGDLSSLKMYEGPLNVNNDDGEEIIIYYSAINFRDVMLASGKLAIDAACKGRINQELPIGLEFSGRLSKSGRRVMGMTKQGALASKLLASNAVLWDVPESWTLEQAASVPVVYGTVYSALVIKGRLRKKESILIHSGTGGVGLAAINVALFYECDIYTTVGTQEKRDYLRRKYPQIPESHIGNSRDTTFEDMINRETNGRGVDLILNSLAEEKLQASCRCLAPGGRFLEIGKFDLANDNPLGMEMFFESRSFHAIHLDSLLYAKNVQKRLEMSDLVAWALKEQDVQPLMTTIFDFSECEQAFRHLTTGKHIGKVLLKLREEEPQKVCIPTPKLFDAVPRFCCSHKKSYVILGGLGGFGLELADWLVMRGARKLVLTSRTGLRTGYQALRIRLWRKYGVETLIAVDDVTTEQGVVNLLTQANKLGPVDSIFNLAVVLRDAIFENQTAEAFATSFGPKALATKYLDTVSRKLCPELKNFVIFSSVSCGRGNAGQTNYGMANSVMERICETRVQEGYPGLAIQWGAIGEVGLVAEMQEDHQELVIGGTLQQTISSCLKCLDVFLKQNHPVVASMVVAEKRVNSGDGNIMDAVANILGITDLKTISLHAPLAELGMDSMMAVEIKQTLERDFDVYLTAQDIRGLSFAKLTQIQNDENVEQSELEGKSSQGANQEDIKKVENQKLLFRLIADEESSMQSLIPLHCYNMDKAVVEKLQSLYGKIPSAFLIPGLEGVVSVLEPLVKNLKFNALGLQFPYNNKCNCNMQEIAKKMLTDFKKHSVPSQPFLLIGYSTGALAALDLASMLESEGYKGKLILIDGAPDPLRKAVHTLFGNRNDSAFEANILHTIYNLFVPGTNLKIRDELINYPTMEEKLQYLETVIPKDVIHRKEHQKRVISDLHCRSVAVMNYNRSNLKKLSSEVVLIRPMEQLFPAVFPDHYNLTEYLLKPVEVHFVEGNHMSMLEGQKIADLINEIYMKCFCGYSSKRTDDIESDFKSQETIKSR